VKIQTFEFIWLMMKVQKVGSCEHSKEPPGSIEGRGFSDQLSNYQLLKDFAPWSYFLNTEYRAGSSA
jgi:hypothetical protein